MITLFFPLSIIIFAGLLVISSVSTQLFFSQLIWVGLGFSLVVFFYFFDWRIFFNYRWLIYTFYLLGVFSLLAVYFWGPAIRQVKGWLVLGPLSFQPAEFMAVALILVYAHYFSRRHLSVSHWKNIFTSFAFFSLPGILVAFQPDLGSAIVLFGIWFGFLLVSGLSFKRIVLSFLVFSIAFILMWSFGFKTYQKERIIGFFYPNSDILGVNYSLNQSKIAIGSAGFWGKGYRQGTQTQLGFLSEPANDFVLAALVEEWGVFGGLIVITSFIILVFNILKIGLAADQNFEKFICLGTAISFGIHFLLNAGSAVGLTPVVGITFPFLSYGGSNMVSSFFLLAIINSIKKRNKLA